MRTQIQRSILSFTSQVRHVATKQATFCQRVPKTHSWSNSVPAKRTLQRPLTTAALVLSGVVAAVFSITPFPKTIYAEAPSVDNEPQTYRLSEVYQHGAKSDRRWVIRGTKVYDITDWIPNHPGGEVILRAVGGVIDQYWDVFSIHKKKDVYDILEQYYIGDVDPRDLVDGEVPRDEIQDPFADDPVRNKSLLVHSEAPCNAETPPEALRTFITPTDQFYVRNHLWAPVLDEKSHELYIELYDGEEKAYSLRDLKEKFEQVEVTATLQCSGNRRRHMTEEARYANGLQWDIGGLSTATFKGARLRDVLADAGFTADDAADDQDIQHVQFQGAEAYGASIPIEKALSRYGDVLLIHTMNNEPLPQDHGFPLRVLVPGYVAARSVKWLKRITLSDMESQSQWQQRDYKCFGPNQSGTDVDWSTAPAIQELPVQSVIVRVRDLPKDNRTLQVYGLEEDTVEVEGYAFAGGGRAIARVDFSPDDGRTWSQAELLPDDAKGSKRWAWKQWRVLVPRRMAGQRFIVKAVDDGYNTQPETYEPNYNFRGNLTNGWHRVGYSRQK